MAVKQLYCVDNPDPQRTHPGGTMPPLTIDLRGVTPDLLCSADKPVLTEAVLEAISPTRPTRDGAGFDNKL